MSIESMHDEIMRRFRRNLHQAKMDALNGRSKTERVYFSDYYPKDDGLEVYAWDNEETAKRVVIDYHDDAICDPDIEKNWVEENYSSIHIADVPEELIQSYIDGLSEDEMEIVATLRGFPFYWEDKRCLRMTYNYDEKLRKEARKLLVSDVEEVPFRPVILLKKIKFIENGKIIEKN